MKLTEKQVLHLKECANSVGVASKKDLTVDKFPVRFYLFSFVSFSKLLISHWFDGVLIIIGLVYEFYFLSVFCKMHLWTQALGTYSNCLKIYNIQYKIFVDNDYKSQLVNDNWEL